MNRIRWIIRRGVLPDNWLGQFAGREPRMVAAAEHFRAALAIAEALHGTGRLAPADGWWSTS